MARVKNDAEPADLMKAIRGNLKDMRLDKAVLANLDQVTAFFEKTLLDILDITARPTSKLLKGACMLVFDCQAEEAQLWGDRLNAAVQYCRLKIKQATTGTRLPEPVRREGRKLQALRSMEETMGERLIKKARMLQRFPSSPKVEAISGAAQAASTSSGAAARVDQACKVPTVLPVIKSAAKADKAAKSSASTSTSLIESQSEQATPVQKQHATRHDGIMALFGLSSASTGGPLHEDLVCVSSSQGSNHSKISIEEEEQSEHENSKEKPKGVYKQFFDSAALKLVRIYKEGGRIEATMGQGSSGFLLASFAGERPITTQVPNVMLMPVPEVMKKPAKAKPKATPKAKGSKRKREPSKNADDEAEAWSKNGDHEDEDPEAESDADPDEPEAPEDDDLEAEGKDAEKHDGKAVEPEDDEDDAPKAAGEYTTMYYKAPRSSYAIRQKFGDKKQIFQLKHGKMSQAACLKIAVNAVAKLHKGEPEEQVKVWALAKCN